MLREEPARPATYQKRRLPECCRKLKLSLMTCITPRLRPSVTAQNTELSTESICGRSRKRKVSKTGRSREVAGLAGSYVYGLPVVVTHHRRLLRRFHYWL
jgi:hypothetical protein